jgi:hypothetical protein
MRSQDPRRSPRRVGGKRLRSCRPTPTNRHDRRPNRAPLPGTVMGCPRRVPCRAGSTLSNESGYVRAWLSSRVPIAARFQVRTIAQATAPTGRESSPPRNGTCPSPRSTGRWSALTRRSKPAVLPRRARPDGRGDRDGVVRQRPLPSGLGRIHWLAILPRWQGRGQEGLGATVRLRDLGHRRAYLITENAGVPRSRSTGSASRPISETLPKPRSAHPAWRGVTDGSRLEPAGRSGTRSACHLSSR